MALTAGGVLAAVRALHPRFHATRVGDPTLLQAVGAALADLVTSGARVNPGALAVEVPLAGVPFAGAPLPPAQALVGGTVHFGPNSYQPAAPLRVVPYAQRFGPAERFAVYELGGACYALGGPEDWPEVAALTLAVVPVPAVPATLTDALAFPEHGRQALVRRVAVTAAVFAQADDPEGGAVSVPAFAQAAADAEDAWLGALAGRRALTPFVVREG